MIASATEIEVELNVPEEVSTFFGVTWAQDPLKDKVIYSMRCRAYVRPVLLTVLSHYFADRVRMYLMSRIPSRVLIT